MVIKLHIIGDDDYQVILNGSNRSCFIGYELQEIFGQEVFIVRQSLRSEALSILQFPHKCDRLVNCDGTPVNHTPLEKMHDVMVSFARTIQRLSAEMAKFGRNSTRLCNTDGNNPSELQSVQLQTFQKIRVSIHQSHRLDNSLKIVQT